MYTKKMSQDEQEIKMSTAIEIVHMTICGNASNEPASTHFGVFHGVVSKC